MTQLESASCALLQTMLTSLKTPFIMGVAGDSGSGKTTFSDGIRKILGKELVQTITMDGYHTENRKTRAKTGHLPLDPAINDFKLFEQHLASLRKGKTIQIPQYNHKTGDFDPKKSFPAAPVILIEGLHALYPQFIPYYDLTIFVDPCRDIKWQWKFARDIKKRGHRAEKLEAEMLAREAAYKRWIDFQKISADIVIKIFNSTMPQFARYEFINSLPTRFYKVELLMKPSNIQLPNVSLPFDLASIMSAEELPFLLASTTCRYWGNKVVNLHIDGAIGEKTIEILEDHIVRCTGIKIGYSHPRVSKKTSHKNVISSTELTQLIIAWRFLEQVNEKLLTRQKEKEKHQ